MNKPKKSVSLAPLDLINICRRVIKEHHLPYTHTSTPEVRLYELTRKGGGMHFEKKYQEQQQIEAKQYLYMVGDTDAPMLRWIITEHTSYEILKNGEKQFERKLIIRDFNTMKTVHRYIQRNYGFWKRGYKLETVHPKGWKPKERKSHEYRGKNSEPHPQDSQ
jgi:hypothetical protein